MATLSKAKRTEPVDDNKIDRLPHEVFVDIFCRLPITSLVQFRLVCRGWNNKLSHDPELVKLQLSHSVKKDPCIIFQSGNHLSFVDLSDPENNEQVRELTLPFLAEFNVVNSCDGLLCISSFVFGDKLYIYNPFTGNYKELPNSGFCDKLYICNQFTRFYKELPSSEFTDFEEQRVMVGFGFDPSTKKYKVVKIVYYSSTMFANIKIWSAKLSHVQILDLSSSKWRSIGQIPYMLHAPSTGVLVNGRLHWLTGLGIEGVIVSFDLCDEGFQEIPMPDFRDSLTRNRNYDHISFLGGCLSVGLSFTFGNVSLQIWVMKEYNVKESWECVYSISANSPVSALCCLKNGEILLKHKDGTLVSYDPKSTETRNLMLKGIPDNCIPIVHVGSLSWIDS